MNIFLDPILAFIKKIIEALQPIIKDLKPIIDAVANTINTINTVNRVMDNILNWIANGLAQAGHCVKITYNYFVGEII